MSSRKEDAPICVKIWGEQLEDPNIERLVKRKKPEGNFILVCATCHDFHPENTSRHNSGMVMLRGPFWSYNFTQHVKSS